MSLSSGVSGCGPGTRIGTSDVVTNVGTNVGTRLALGHLNFGRLSHSLAKVGAAAGAHLVGVFGLDDARRASALDDGW